MAKGAAWMVLLQWSMRGLSLIVTVILARLLVPADFGLVGLATVVLAALEVLGGFGFDLAVIRDQRADRRTYDTAWTLIILRGAVLALITALCAPIAARFFGDSRLELIMYAFAAGVFVESFKNIGIVDFRKHLLFSREFKFLLLTRTGQLAASVALAFAWRSYWALVCGVLVGDILRLALSYAMHGYRPRFSLSAWRGIMHFSKWLVVNNVLNFVYLQSPTLFIGKAIGVPTVGLYRVSFDISNLPTTQLMNPIVTAVFPGFSKLAENTASLRASFLGVLSAVLFLAAPASIGISLTAKHIVPVFLGMKWIEAIPLIQILALYGLLNVARASSETVFLAIGRPFLVALVRGISAGIQLPMLALSVPYAQAVGASWAITGAAGVALVTSLGLALPILQIRPLQLVAALWRTAIATAVMAGAVVGLELGLPSAGGGAHPAVRLALEIISGILVYVGAHFALWWLAGQPDSPEWRFVSTVRTKLGATAAP